MKIIFYVAFLLFLIPGFVFGQSIPTGTAITPNALLELLRNVGGFLYIAGGILATLTIIVTGIMYLMSGGSAQKLTAAKGMFKAGIIGAFIIFSAGMIISTITYFATNPLGFFGGNGGGGGVVQYCWYSSGTNTGIVCQSSADCLSGEVCRP